MREQHGFHRGWRAVKNQWNRYLRKASGIEDRGVKRRTAGMVTSALNAEKDKGEVRLQGKRDQQGTKSEVKRKRVVDEEDLSPEADGPMAKQRDTKGHRASERSRHGQVGWI